jgi:hypothetical protein
MTFKDKSKDCEKPNMVSYEDPEGNSQFTLNLLVNPDQVWDES